jgi:thymidylate synthase (FAD)
MEKLFYNKVLDYGYIKLIDFMGNDRTVINCARISFDKADFFEDKQLNEDEINFINNLAKNKHESPFFHPQIQFEFRMPIVIARQWLRSTVGFSFSEQSRRYTKDNIIIYSPYNLKGKDDIENSVLTRKIYKQNVDSLNTYNYLIDNGVSLEQARFVLPQSTYTKFVETGSLFAWARLYNLRNKFTHSQGETQEYAEALGKIIDVLFPVSWKALTKGN